MTANASNDPSPVPTGHVLLCYASPYGGDRLLSKVAALCEEREARLSVLLPVIDEAPPRACCGIQGEQWGRLVDEDARDALRQAARRLTDLGVDPERLVLEAGPSIPEVVERAAAQWGCTIVAAARKRRPWSGGLSRRQLTALRRDVGRELVELSDA